MKPHELKEARRRLSTKGRKMTQEKLASLLRCSTQTVRNYEAGRHPIPYLVEEKVYSLLCDLGGQF